MNALLGPLDENGRVPALQQTRVAAFLMSAHGAQARQLAAILPGSMQHVWQMELHAQYCRELEIISLLTRATTWTPDPQLWPLIWQWEMVWLLQPVRAELDHLNSVLVDMAALGHAIHGGVRPAALLPENAAASDPFVLAMRRIEFESGRLLQAQILFLKSQALTAARKEVAGAVERRHEQVRDLWTTMLRGLDIVPQPP
jgi:hypothetical protein